MAPLEPYLKDGVSPLSIGISTDAQKIPAILHICGASNGCKSKISLGLPALCVQIKGVNEHVLFNIIPEVIRPKEKQT